MSQHPSRDVATARPVQPWTGLSWPNGLTSPSMQPPRREIKPSARVGNVSVWVLVGRLSRRPGWHHAKRGLQTVCKRETADEIARRAPAQLGHFTLGPE